MSTISDRMTGLEMDLARRVYVAGLEGTLAAAQREVYARGYAYHVQWERRIAEATEAKHAAERVES